MMESSVGRLDFEFYDCLIKEVEYSEEDQKLTVKMFNQEMDCEYVFLKLKKYEQQKILYLVGKNVLGLAVKKKGLYVIQLRNGEDVVIEAEEYRKIKNGL